MHPAVAWSSCAELSAAQHSGVELTAERDALALVLADTLLVGVPVLDCRHAGGGGRPGGRKKPRKYQKDAALRCTITFAADKTAF